MIIAGGLIHDGSGGEPKVADVGIKNGRIVAVGKLSHRASRVIEAHNHVVAPGFVDLHGHSDENLLVDGLAQSKVRQGVTTEVIGQDGGSLAPLNERMREELHAQLQQRFGLTVEWSDFAGYFNQLRASGIAMNVTSMVGAGTLREHVIGYDNRPASVAEMERMQELLRTALAQGARHLSSGLEYTPGSFASTEELTAIASVMGPAGVYSTHLRNEDDHLLDAIAEAVTIAKSAGVALNISHLKVQGQRNWHRLPEVFAAIARAQANGVRVTCDRYPYVAYSTGLTNLFPLWSREGGTEAFLQRLRDPSHLPAIQREVEDKIAALGSWNAVMIASLAKNQNYVGQRLGDLSAGAGRPPFDFLVNLMLDEGGHGGMVGFGMSEENTARILAHPDCAVASDGSALATSGPLASGNPHPRNFGSFPRVLRYYVREQQLLSMSEAIRKMTALPAMILGLTDRGRIAPGTWADVVVFDPDRVADVATFENPKQYSVGMRAVLVNGEVVVENDEHTGAKPGQVLV